MPKRSDLTPTSYAILGLLAIRPWTTYELAQQMERALGRFWPRTRSKLYEEPKKLVAHGLARASTETVGKRERTRYSITTKGRRALADWVPTPGAGPQLEFESLLKVFFAEHGTKQDLVATLEDVRAWAREQARGSHAIPRDYLEGKGDFPERLPWLILTGRFLHDFQRMVDDWARWALGIVDSWPDDLSAAKPDLAALEAIATLADTLAADTGRQ
ncbi:MAG TPA: helix-turn-helix transcriptional regulator [Nocardioides sp.]|nr:helix-turn-helix transcriptional regulator [Nocardioides sp.]